MMNEAFKVKTDLLKSMLDMQPVEMKLKEIVKELQENIDYHVNVFLNVASNSTAKQNAITKITDVIKHIDTIKQYIK